MFRVTGSPKPTATSEPLQIRYAMIFRLNRDAALKVDASYQLPQGVATQVGNYDILSDGSGWSDENGIVPFGRTARHCFTGHFTTDWPETVGQLDQIGVGKPVRVTLQPLTPKAHGKLRLGTTYVRHPRMSTADYALRQSAARRQLERIGCPAGNSDVAGFG